MTTSFDEWVNQWEFQQSIMSHDYKKDLAKRQINDLELIVSQPILSSDFTDTMRSLLEEKKEEFKVQFGQ